MNICVTPRANGRSSHERIQKETINNFELYSLIEGFLSLSYIKNIFDLKIAVKLI